MLEQVGNGGNQRELKCTDLCMYIFTQTHRPTDIQTPIYLVASLLLEFRKTMGHTINRGIFILCKHGYLYSFNNSFPQLLNYKNNSLLYWYLCLKFVFIETQPHFF